MTVPIAIWPPERFDQAVLTLRAAERAIDADVVLTPLLAVGGAPGSTLAFGSLPPWVADVILIAPSGVEDVTRVAAALQHWLDGGAPTFTAADMLTRFGLPAREITNEFDLGNAEHDFEMQKARLK